MRLHQPRILAAAVSAAARAAADTADRGFGNRLDMRH